MFFLRSTKVSRATDTFLSMDTSLVLIHGIMAWTLVVRPHWWLLLNLLPIKLWVMLFCNLCCTLLILKIWNIFKVFIEFVTILILFYVLLFWPCGMWDLVSPSGDWTHILCSSVVESEVLATGPGGKSLSTLYQSMPLGLFISALSVQCKCFGQSGKGLFLRLA